MNTLDTFDTAFIHQRIPKYLIEILTKEKWIKKVFIGGGFIRSIIANEPINDIDMFVGSIEEANELANEIAMNPYGKNYRIYETEFAKTIIRDGIKPQIITKWLYTNIEDVVNSFDFTVCCAAVTFDAKEYSNAEGKMKPILVSHCIDRFYTDLASKRLVYTCPDREEMAGGSMLRVLKYYQRGYRIDLTSLSQVITRMINKLDPTKIDEIKDFDKVSHVMRGLLIEVDPNVVNEFYFEKENESDRT